MSKNIVERAREIVANDDPECDPRYPYSKALLDAVATIEAIMKAKKWTEIYEKARATLRKLGEME